MSRMHIFLSFLALSTAFIDNAWTADEGKDALRDRKVKKAIIAKDEVAHKSNLNEVVDALIEQKTPEAAFDILSLLTGEELSQGGKKGSFAKKTAPTEEDFLAVIKGMRYVVSTFAGNFPLKTYFLEKPEYYTEQGKAFKAHMNGLYMIGRYFEHLMHARDAKATFINIADDFQDEYTYQKALKLLPVVNDIAQEHGLDRVRLNEPHRVILLNSGSAELIEDSPLGQHYLKGGVELPSEVLVPTFEPNENTIIGMETLSHYDKDRLTPIVARQNADNFLINQYDEFLIYRFLLTDSDGNKYLCGYLDPKQAFLIPQDIQKDNGVVGKIMFLSTGKRTDDIVHKAENLNTLLTGWRGSLYPVQELNRGDHIGRPIFDDNIKNNQNLVGSAPLILKDLIPAGYIEDHFRERGIINLTQIENPEVAFTPLRLEQFESPYPITKGAKEELTLAIAARIQAEKERQEFLDKAVREGHEADQEVLRQLNENFRAAKSEEDEARGHLTNAREKLMESIRGPLAQNKTIQYTSMRYDDVEVDTMIEGEKGNAQISYITSPSHLKAYIDHISDKEFVENNEYYMIESNKESYELQLKNFGADYYAMLYRDFYTPRILYRLDKRDWTLHKESEGILGPDMILQLGDFKKYLNEKYEDERNDTKIKFKKLNPNLGYNPEKINIDQDRAERNIYVHEPIKRAVQVNVGDIKKLKIDPEFALKFKARVDNKEPVVKREVKKRERVRAVIPGNEKQVK